MGLKTVILTFAVLGFIIPASGIGIGADADHYLYSWNEKLTGEDGTVRELTENEYATVSPSGDTYALLKFKSDAMPLASTVKVFDRGGRLIYTVNNSGAGLVRLADSGAAVFITMIGNGPQAKGHLEFYSPSGAKTGSADVGFPGDAVFFNGDADFAITAMGDATYVYNTDTGDEKYALPVSRSIIGSDGDNLLLIADEWLALYNEGTQQWRVNHGLYFPRMGIVSDNGTEALIGCHHEVALVNMSNGDIEHIWEAPGDFGVTDIAASGDFSTIAVGLRTLDGTESIQVLDGNFKLKSAEEHKVTHPSGAMPMVAVLDSGVVAIGQGWQTELAK
ncbi:MAG: hypothetical protein GY771_07470 [bacterium]|nr:hypothetical protein [bacterium]